ncbi:RAD55 family ATPase [Magnetospirillum fulvum]|uniref:RecA-superfamily ATPase, KaiC/GvpD/RAD55 family n=1 Tax=Magnetospirillum fulvum TaxID=1082 RepID=A0A1H6HAH8_MAGFU|nr:RAD55 family ATPase [Magnetospirillum fulvum]SEH31195.1 RecA-superfamily ATPase, KaiC/GvpD/RAD55 family [Magnetospirillum fulvum]
MNEGQIVPTDLAPTGIADLDLALRGGMSRGRGYMISGDIYSGKEAIARHIQFSALVRGESGIYISFTKPFHQIISDFSARGQDVRPFIDSNNFGIIDCNYLHHGYSENSLQDAVGIHKNIKLLNSPLDLDALFDADRGLRNIIGYNGVTVIDSLSDHIILAEKQGVPPHSIINHHRRCKDYFAGRFSTIGIHTFDKELCKACIKRHKEYEAFLHALEDGAIIIDKIKPSARKYFMYFAVKSSGVCTPKFDFEIAPDNINIFGMIDEMRGAENMEGTEKNHNVILVAHNSGQISVQGDATQNNINATKKPELTDTDNHKGFVSKVVKTLFSAVAGYFKGGE